MGAGLLSRLDEISDCPCGLRIPSIHALRQSVPKMDELLLVARQYRRVERDDIIDRRFGVQFPHYLLSLFAQDARSGTEYRWVAVPFCCRARRAGQSRA